MIKEFVYLFLIFSIVSSHIDLLRIVNDENIIYSINSKKTTWEAGVNERFADMNLRYVKKLLGALKTPDYLRLPIKKVKVRTDLPENFDPREKWPMCESLKEIRDQSTCGSCWAFGAAEAMSDRICIASQGQLQTRISTEHLLACCSTCGDGCNGGWPTMAWEYWKSHGLPTGGLYGDKKTCQPYSFPPCDHHMSGKYGPCSGEEFPTPKCSHTCSSGYPKPFHQDLWYASNTYTLSSKEEEIMTELYENGPLEGAFTVYEDFLNYKKGVYQNVVGSSLGGHAIKVIGWGIENGVKYWLCVNSWNDGWGYNGTFKILRGDNHCGIEEELVGGEAKIKSENLQFLEEEN
jgi:cathepsin B